MQNIGLTYLQMKSKSIQVLLLYFDFVNDL
jgi:hypothetical protein